MFIQNNIIKEQARKQLLKAKFFLFSVQFQPFLTEFDDSECNKCAPNNQSQLQRRECVWYEGNSEDQCEEKRSFTNSWHCENATLEMICVPNGIYSPFIYFCECHLVVTI